MESIKLGRNTYEIKRGDYVLYNGKCYQFIAGDKRSLGYDGHSKITSLGIPKNRLKEIPFDQLDKRQSGNEADGTLIIRWIF